MLRIAFDLCGAKFVALHQQRNAASRERHRGRKEFWNSRNEIFGLANVRNDRFRGLTCASGESSERHRSAGELEKIAAREAIFGAIEFGNAGGELAFEKLFETGFVDQLFQTPPVLLARRSREPLAYLLERQLSFMRRWRGLDLHQLGVILFVSLDQLLPKEANCAARYRRRFCLSVAGIATLNFVWSAHVILRHQVFAHRHLIFELFPMLHRLARGLVVRTIQGTIP